MSFEFCKKDNKLDFIDHGGYQTRNDAVMWCIKEADRIYNWPDFNKRIKVMTGDYHRGENDPSIVSFCKVHPDEYGEIPDFNFGYWPETGVTDYDTTINQIQEAGRSSPEINKCGWIGNLYSLGNDKINYRVVLHQISMDHKDIMEINHMQWSPSGINPTFISMPDLVKKYALLIDIEGNGYSGRLKYLMWSGRPMLLVDRPYKEYFYKYLKPWEHYIPVERNLSDVIIKTKWALKNYEKAKLIGQNALEFAKKYLTRSACYSQWNDVVSRHIVADPNPK